jgi:molybdenum cofactor guanylyltransferase
MPSAAILMGGEARRFGGRDKGGLLIDGRSILERQMDELSTIADEILLVGARQMPRMETDSPAARPERSRREAGHHVRIVPDRVAGCGPLGGLDAALAATIGPLIVVACDMPFVTARFLDYLRSLTAEADAVVPRTERGYHPVCAAYTQACRPAIETALAAHRLSMSEWLERVRVRVVEADEIDAFGSRARLLANVNTPAELHELGALSSHQL